MLNFVTAYLGGTHGTAKSACDFLWAMLRNERAVCVQTPDTVRIPDNIAFEFGNRLHHLTTAGELHSPLRPSRWYQRIPRQIATKAHVRLLRSHDPVIVNGWASIDFWKQVSSQYHGTKTIIVREGPSYFKMTKHTPSPEEVAGVLAEFDSMVFVSRLVGQEWLQHSALSQKHTYVLPNCCKEEEILRVQKTDRDALREELGYASDELVCICPSRLEHAKGQDLIIDVIPKILEAVANIRFVFLGAAPGESGEQFVNSIANLERCEWIREKPSATDYIYASDILLFPSRTEAMPRTVLEAMATGMPIIASRVGGIPELITDGDSGILFSVGDENALHANILRLATSAETRQRLAESAHSRYWSTFSRAQQIANIKDILESLKRSKATRRLVDSPS